jgi:hypothetical protein
MRAPEEEAMSAPALPTESDRGCHVRHESAPAFERAEFVALAFEVDEVGRPIARSNLSPSEKPDGEEWIDGDGGPRE